MTNACFINKFKMERSNQLAVVAINNSGMLVKAEIEMEKDQWQRLKILQN